MVHYSPMKKQLKTLLYRRGRIGFTARTFPLSELIVGCGEAASIASVFD
jgi:hypothetical protein